jgi:RimJ/RimL family protein N-acetyltransferase
MIILKRVSITLILKFERKIDEKYRGQGVFAGMYQKYFETYKGPFDYIITEIAARNTRSMHAHIKVGFQEIYRYDEPGMEEWVVVLY